MGIKTERGAGTKMQSVILLKRPTFLLYVGVESFPCAILLKVYKLQEVLRVHFKTKGIKLLQF